MLSLKLLDQETFVINNSIKQIEMIEPVMNALSFKSNELSHFIKSSLSLKKNVLLIKEKEATIIEQTEVLNLCYQNKEKLQKTDRYVFIPLRLKKQIIKQDSKSKRDWFSLEL